MMRKLIRNAGKTGLGTVLLLLFLFFWISPSRALGESYRYIDIHPPGWLDSRVTCINGNGEAVGFGTTDSGERGFLWRSGTMKGYVKSGEFYIDMTPDGWSSSRAMAINDFNEVAAMGIPRPAGAVFSGPAATPRRSHSPGGHRPKRLP